jgi:tetratricopeptide (TPR) repeat protein
VPNSHPSPGLDLILQARGFLAAGQPREALSCAEKALDVAPRDSDALYLLGAAHYHCGDLPLAEARLRQAIQADGRVAAFHATLGNVLQDRGVLDEAIRAYRRAIRLKPDFAEPHNDLGTAYFAQGNAPRAAESYVRAAQLRPDHAVALSNLASVYRKLGLPGEARRALQRELLLRLLRGLRRITRVRSPSLVELARLELEQGNARLAARIAQRAIDQEPASAAALRMLGAAQQRLGAAAEAQASLEAAVALEPGDALAREMLGRLLSDAGQHDAAIAQLEQSVRLRPRSTQGLLALAELYLTKGGFERAEELARQALKRNPSAAAAHFVLGETLFKQGKTQAAEKALREAIAIEPQHLASRIRLGDLLRHGGQLEEAEACLREALARDEESASALVALGMVLHDRAKIPAALQCLEQAVRLEPARVQALQQIGRMLRYDDRLDESERRFRDALKIRPGDLQSLVDLAAVLGDQMRYQDAFACIDQALARYPASAIALGAQAVLLDLTGKKSDAKASFQAALRAAPENVDIGYSLGICRLRHGELAEGWAGYELRRRSENFVGRYRKFPFPEWQSESLEGKTILVYPEQGLGDEIMFSSCIPELVGLARHVAIECDPKLGKIFKRSFPACTVMPRMRTMANDWVNHLESRPDYQVPIGTLALRFRERAEQFPAHRGYLAADEGRVAEWKRRLEALGPGPKIGLSWRGGVGHTGKARRSLTLEQLRPLLQIPDAHFISLQYTDVQAELAELRTRHAITVHHWQDAIDDYDETAALVCALDQVVTVCTAIVHLTGALGRPAIVMVPFGSDWRYGAEGSRMLWYPSVRLVRQSVIGEWSAVLETVAGLIARSE